MSQSVHNDVFSKKYLSVSHSMQFVGSYPLHVLHEGSHSKQNLLSFMNCFWEILHVMQVLSFEKYILGLHSMH
jgi:hypothetical protein